MTKPKDLEIYIKIVVDRAYLEKHSLGECFRFVAEEVATVSREVVVRAAKKIEKIKRTGRL